MNWEIWLPLLTKGTADTLYMVGVSTLLTIAVGLPLGIILVLTDQNGLLENSVVNSILGTIVNIARSLPFIILLVIVIPLTRAITGTTIGATAAIVPLTLSAIPFFARVAESSIREVDSGLVEAAQAMGAHNTQIVFKVLIPEALSSLILGIALTIISLIGYSAMAGTIGGGGLGDLAIRYGYQRYETSVMTATVVLLIVLVQGIQYLGSKLALKISHK